MSHKKSMHRQFFVIPLSLALIVLGSCAKKETSMEQAPPPKAKRVPMELTLHGHTRTDDYYWLKERTHPDVITYLKTENDYAERIMASTENIQKALIDEFNTLSEQPCQPITYKKGDYLYFARMDAGEQYPVYCRRKAADEAKEEVFLDANRLAEGHSVFALAELQISPGQDILAYGMDTQGERDFFTFYFKDLKTGTLLPDVIPDVHHLTAWANDNRTFFYVKANRIYSHELGTDISEDKFYMENVSFLYKSKSDRYILVFSNRYSWDWKGYLDAGNPEGPFGEIFSHEPGAQFYKLEHVGDKFYFLDNGQLHEIPVQHTDSEEESRILFHKENITIENFEVFKDYLALWEKKDTENRLRIISLANGSEQELEFDESIFSVSDGRPRDLTLRTLCNAEFDSPVLRYGYSSPTTPYSLYDLNMATGKASLVSRQNINPSYNPKDYEAELIWASGEDGTKIPISLVHLKTMKKNGRNPLLLEGYGMYGVSERLEFSSYRLSLMNRGFICAVAHVRGGGEFPDWHEGGMLLKKKNSFTDFIACAKHLIDQDYTRPDRLFAKGSSGGGLLMAGATTMAPELFKGVIIGVPFLDIITTVIEEDQQGNTVELGNPDDKEYYEYMLSYAPYENIKAQAYPNILITAGYYDTHVYYWPAAKFAAKMRAKKTDHNMIFLKTNMESGHAGAEFSGQMEKYKETAAECAFILYLAGIER